MPMNFPDMDSLLMAAEVHGFPKPKECKCSNDEKSYRQLLATFVKDKDPIEAHEIRTGKGWDRWTDDEKRECINISPQVLILPVGLMWIAAGLRA